MDFVISSYLLACLLGTGRVLARSVSHTPARLLGLLQGACFWQAGIPSLMLATFNAWYVVRFVCCAVSFCFHQNILANRATQPQEYARCSQDLQDVSCRKYAEGSLEAEGLTIQVTVGQLLSNNKFHPLTNKDVEISSILNHVPSYIWYNQNY